MIHSPILKKSINYCTFILHLYTVSDATGIFDRFTSDVAVLLIQQKNMTNFHLLKNNLVYKLMFNNNDNNNNKIIIIIIIIIIICKHIRLQLKKLDHNFPTNILGYPHARTHTHTRTHTIHKSGRLN